MVEEHVHVVRDYSGLVRLGNVAVDAVYLADQIAVFGREPGVSENRSRVQSYRTNVADQISERALGKLHAVNLALGCDYVADMAHCRSACGSEVEDFRTWPHRHLGETLENGRSEFASVGVPDSILFALGLDCCLSVRGVPGNQVECRGPLVSFQACPVDAFDLRVRSDSPGVHPSA